MTLFHHLHPYSDKSPETARYRKNCCHYEEYNAPESDVQRIDPIT